MISHRTQVFLNRVPAHPTASTIKNSVVDALTAAEQLEARKAEMASAGRLTAMGQRQALQDDLTGKFGKALARANDPITKARKDIAKRRDALVVKVVDPSNIAAALERQEIRGWFRTLDAPNRQSVALTTEDARILDALCTAPPELSGFIGELARIVPQVEQRYLKLNYANEMAELETLEALVEVGEAAVTTARQSMRSIVDMDERTFDTIMKPIEQGVGRPWLLKRGDKVIVCEYDFRDKVASYRDASPDDLSAGIYYENFDAFQQAQAA